MTFSIGANLTGTWTSAQLINGDTPSVGDHFYSHDGKIFKFVQYDTGAGAVAAVAGQATYYYAPGYLYLIEHPDAKWTQDDERTPVNQDAVVVPMYWMGQLCTSNRALQGRIHDLA